MIFILKNADFSKNNVGVIDLTFEVSDETKQLLSNYDKTFFDTEQFAVQRFITGLKDNNIWDKINNLYIPALAGSLATCMYNLKSNTIDAVPNDNAYMMEQNGLRTKEYGIILSSDDTTTVQFTGKYKDMHYMVYTPTVFSNDYIDKDKENYFFTGIDSSSYKGLRTGYTSVNGRWNIIMTGNPSKYTVAEPTLGNFIAVTCSDDGITYGFSKDKYYSQSEAESKNNEFTDMPVYIGCEYNRKASCVNPMNIISMGKSLTKDELTIYQTLCDSLIAAIC